MVLKFSKQLHHWKKMVLH